MKPRILFYDVETRPNLGYTWSKYEQNVLSFEREWELLSCAFKFQGDKEVQCVTRQGKKDDLRVVKKVQQLFQEADILVAHNGDEFDFKKLTARMLFHGLPPVKPLAMIDTKKVAKKHFSFNGNGLADLGKFLRLGDKIKHTGFDLWLGCMQDDPTSWRQMIAYNKQDVTLLEKVYDRFRPWIIAHPNVARLLGRTSDSACPTCASGKTQKWGFRVTARQQQQRWGCLSCGRFFLTPVPKKKKVKK